jgi:hypothetical protein
MSEKTAASAHGFEPKPADYTASMHDVEHGYVGCVLIMVKSADPLCRRPSNDAHTVNGNSAPVKDPQHQETLYQGLLKREQVFWDRLRGKGRRVPGWAESGKNILLSSCE